MPSDNEDFIRFHILEPPLFAQLHNLYAPLLISRLILWHARVGVVLFEWNEEHFTAYSPILDALP
jgi:hypothetical protein